MSAQPWHRRSGETSKQYAAFCHYRDQKPAERTLTEAARRTYGAAGVTKTGNVVGRIRVWFDDNDWEARALAFDQHNDSIREAEWQKEIADAARRDAQEAQLIQAVLLAPARALAAKIDEMRKAGDRDGTLLFKDLDVDELVRLVDRAGRGHALAGRFKRLSMGLTEGRVEVTGAGGGPIEMTIEAAKETLAPILGCEPDAVVDQLAERRKAARARERAAGNVEEASGS